MPRRQVRGEVVALGGYAEAVRRLKGCRVEADGLFCEGALVARRAEVRAATVVFDGGWHVRLETSEGKRLDVEVEDESVAESMVEALEVEPARTRTSVRAASPFVWPWTALAAMSATLLIGIVFRQLGWAPARVGSMAVAGAVGFLSGAGLSMLRMDVQIFADGVTTRFMGRRRTYRLDDIQRVFMDEVYEGRVAERIGFTPPKRRVAGVELVLRSNERARIRLRDAEVSARVVRRRLDDALRAFRSGGSDAVGAVLPRGSRSVGEWVDALRRLGAFAEGHHRRAPLDAERLVRIAVDASAPALARATAALAVSRVVSAEDRVRIRESAAKTVSPDLRVVLERAATEDAERLPEEIEAAMTALEADANRAQAKHRY